MSHSQFKPSLYEHPIIRVRFTDPNGGQQQSSYSTTWKIPGLEDLVNDEKTEAGMYLLNILQEQSGGFLSLFGCTNIRVELVHRELHEMIIEGDSA